MIDTFSTVAADRHGAAKAWKEETGKRVFGYFAGVSPEEILFAADVLPIRITAIDGVENRVSSRIDVILDDTPPEAEIDHPGDHQVFNIGATVEIEGTASDARGLSGVELRLDEALTIDF